MFLPPETPIKQKVKEYKGINQKQEIYLRKRFLQIFRQQNVNGRVRSDEAGWRKMSLGVYRKGAIPSKGANLSCRMPEKL